MVQSYPRGRDGQGGYGHIAVELDGYNQKKFFGTEVKKNETGNVGISCSKVELGIFAANYMDKDTHFWI